MPNERFGDVQLRGAYRYWHHLHEFRAVPARTERRDCIDYELPFGPLGSLAHALTVVRLLKTIFDYRITAVERAFAGGR